MPKISWYRPIAPTFFGLLFALGIAAPCPAQGPEPTDSAFVEQNHPQLPADALPDSLAVQASAQMPTVMSTRFRHDEHNAKAKLKKQCAACHHSLQRGKRSVKRAGPLRRCSDCHLVRPEPTSPLPSHMLVSHAACQGCHKARKKGPLDCEGCHGTQRSE